MHIIIMYYEHVYIYVCTYIRIQHKTFTVMEHNAVDDSKTEVSQEDYDDVLVENKVTNVRKCAMFKIHI